MPLASVGLLAIFDFPWLVDLSLCLHPHMIFCLDMCMLQISEIGIHTTPT